MVQKKVKLKFQRKHSDFQLPIKAEPGSAGFDMKACIDQPITLQPGHRVLIPLGCAVEIPVGWEIQVRPRSGLALKEGITILNSPGTIDSSFRGLCGAIVVNHGDQWYTIRPQDKICQWLIAEVPEVTCELVEELSNSDRGQSGFGSSGR